MKTALEPGGEHLVATVNKCNVPRAEQQEVLATEATLKPDTVQAP